MQIFKCQIKDNDIYIYGDIVDYKWYEEDVTANAIKESLSKMSGDINVYINSNGGDVFQSIAIYNQLKRYEGKKTVYIDGIAASGASIIAMAGDEIIMGKNTQMMIHNAWTIGWGNANDFRKLADDLEKCNESVYETYSGRFKGENLKELLDNETFLTAKEALDCGLCDKILEIEEKQDSPQNYMNYIKQIYNKKQDEERHKENQENLANQNTLAGCFFNAIKTKIEGGNQ